MAIVRMHEDETGCTYSAAPVKPFHWFCNMCGWAEREAPAIVDEGTDAVLEQDFYRCPNTGEWVYKWADERLVLGVPADLDHRHPDCPACDASDAAGPASSGSRMMQPKYDHAGPGTVAMEDISPPDSGGEGASA